MFNIKPNRRGLIQLLLISLGITTVINGIIFTFNINDSIESTLNLAISSLVHSIAMESPYF